MRGTLPGQLEGAGIERLVGISRAFQFSITSNVFTQSEGKPEIALLGNLPVLAYTTNQPSRNYVGTLIDTWRFGTRNF